MYTGGKDCAVIRWDVETGKKAGDSQVVELLAVKSFSAARLHLEHFSTLTGLQRLMNLCSRPI